MATLDTPTRAAPAGTGPRIIRAVGEMEAQIREANIRAARIEGQLSRLITLLASPPHGREREVGEPR